MDEMMGNLGVFASGELLAEFGDWDAADEYLRKTILQEGLPEHLRTPAYDHDDLEIRDLDAEEGSLAAA